MVKTQYKITVWHLRSDNGREYVSDEFHYELAKQDILEQFTCPYTHEQNGIEERKNHLLVSIVRCLLRGMNVPKYFWHITVLTAAFLLNRTPSRSL